MSVYTHLYIISEDYTPLIDTTCVPPSGGQCELQGEVTSASSKECKECNLGFMGTPGDHGVFTEKVVLAHTAHNTRFYQKCQRVHNEEKHSYCILF